MRRDDPVARNTLTANPPDSQQAHTDPKVNTSQR